MEKRNTSSSPLHWGDDCYRRGGSWTNRNCFEEEEETTMRNLKKKRGTRSRRSTVDDLPLPDECLAHAFKFLDLIDRKNCSLVCHRWFCIEGQSRHHLCLNAKRRHKYLSVQILPDDDIIRSLLIRFDSLTSLALNYVQVIGDNGLVLISLRCRNLTRLKLRGCRALTDTGVVDFAVNCKGLKAFHAEWCEFGAEAINAIVYNSPFLEELYALTLGGLAAGNSKAAAAVSSIGPGVAASSLKTICIGQRVTPSQIDDGEYYIERPNAQCFVPLIIASKNLRNLKIYGSSGKDWDKVFEAMVKQEATGLVEIQLMRLEISDAALVSISNFSDLEMLRLAETINCTDAGLAYIANRCKRLRRLYIQNWSNLVRIGNEGITAIARGCPKLEGLFLMQVPITCLTLNMLAENCPNLESLALCWDNTVRDAEMKFIAAKFMALKNLNMHGCLRITDQGVLALSGGCPNLVHVEITNCDATTWDGLRRLKAERDSLFVNYCRRQNYWPLWADRVGPGFYFTESYLEQHGH